MARGTCWRNPAAIGSIRSAGIRLFANGVQLPVAGSIVSGSQIGANPAKSPARIASDGTENVRVSDRFIRSPS